MSILIIIIAFLISLSIHEAAHAYVADYLGDPTARLAGRKTLNPLAHLDPLGSLLPLFLLLTGSPFIFGWGKPVPIDPFNLQKPRKDAAIISFAGPLSSFLLACLLAVIIRLGHYLVSPSIAYLLEIILTPAVILNISWAFFNLLPIHPLDGGKVLIGLLPADLALKWDKILNQYGFIILLFLIFPFAGHSPLMTILSPLIRIALYILLPGTPLV